MPSVITELTGTVNGVNATFTTPTVYRTGTIRPIINGVVYPQADDDWGCTEVDEETITLNTAPETGYLVQAFYEEAVSIGLPVDPNGVYP